MGSQTDGLRVFHTETGVDLGEVCRNVHNPRRYAVDNAGAYITCLGPREAAVWPLPEPPIQQGAPPLADVDGRWTVGTDGETIRVVAADGTSTPWHSPGIGEIAATAISDDTNHVIAGSSGGWVALLDRRDGDLSVALRWRTPDRSRIASLDWSPGPVASTVSGLGWKVPDCRGCSEREKLIETYRDMRKPCWESQNLQGVDFDARVALQLFMCGSET